MRHIRVAVPVPALEALTYRLPDISIDPVVGARVLVPLGKRDHHRRRHGPHGGRGRGRRHQDGRRRAGRRGVPAGGDRLAGFVGGRLLRVRRRRSDRRGDAAARLDRERAPRAHHRRRPRADAARTRRQARDPRAAGEREAAARRHVDRRGPRYSRCGAWARARRPADDHPAARRQRVGVSHGARRAPDRAGPRGRTCRRAAPPTRRRGRRRRRADAPSRAVNRKRSGCWPRHRTESTAPSSAGEGSRPPS